MWRPMYAIVVPLARAGVRTSKVPMLGVMLPRDTRSFTSTPRVRFSSAFTETCVHTWCHADPFMIPAGMHFHWPNRSRRGDSTPNLPLTRLLLHIDHGLLPATSLSIVIVLVATAAPVDVSSCHKWCHAGTDAVICG